MKTFLELPNTTLITDKRRAKGRYRNHWPIYECWASENVA